MSHTSDHEYFAYRVEQESESGHRAASPAIAAIHFELAYRYALLCRESARPAIMPMMLKCA